MASDRQGQVTATFDAQLRARVARVCASFAITDALSVSHYTTRLLQELQRRHGDDLPDAMTLEPDITECLVTLNGHLLAQSAGGPAEPLASPPPAASAPPTPPPQAAASAPAAISPTVDDGQGGPVGIPQRPDTATARRPARAAWGRPAQRWMRSQEEKMAASREPLRALLRHECVQLQLVDHDSLPELLNALPGKTVEDANRELCNVLGVRLLTQVRRYIRTHDGGPWQGALRQEAVRQAVLETQNLANLVLLARELAQEARDWARRHGRPEAAELLPEPVSSAQASAE